MATVSLDNYLGDIVHPVGAVQLSAFLSKQHIANFLNIPYADVPTRFRRATPVCLYNLPSPYDATRYGPRCPQEAGTLHLAMSHLFERVSEVQQLSDETKCLNLNIYTPPSALGTGASPPLPVFVWIHGGAFNAGDNTVQFDGNHLVKRSVEINQPIVVVVVNYRLNLIGALSSRELNEGAKALGETPIPNQDLHDQRTALQWVQSYIHHFGGDPARVTLCGESAGAYSVLCHLKGGVPLFQQALIQSPPLPPLRTPEEAQAAFDKLVISAGSSLDASSTDKLAAIRSLSAQQLVHLFDGSFSTPIEDPNWFAGYDRNSADISAYWADVPSWCSRVILGNTQDETALMLAPIANLTAEETIAFTKRVTPQVCVPASLATSPRTKRELIGWSSDQAFISPLMNLASAATAQSPATRFYVYRISCPDPFPGPLRGYAWHSYGIPFTFNQPACRTYPELATVQDEITSAFLKFAHGCEPWKAFDDAREVMRWSEKGGEMVGSELLVR
ncbi:para-nitrobenzyl esterase [Ilyonectria destructans]|nr:para-nitrobenzyl esterase [Ilyonectria destructans]